MTSNNSRGCGTPQDIILKLTNFWVDQECTMLQPYDMPMGAGTFHPATIFYSYTPKRYRAVFVQPCRRPTDVRGAHENTNRLQKYLQMQVVLKPGQDEIVDTLQQQNTAKHLYLKSLEKIGLSVNKNDIRFVEDNWNSPTLGAYGVGWEVWCNGMEITQFTYMQQLCGVNCRPVICEITYGLERMAMQLQNVKSVYDLAYDEHHAYGEFHKQEESQHGKAQYNSEDIFKEMETAKFKSRDMLKKELPLVAYESYLYYNHLFNLLDAGGYVSHGARTDHVRTLRDLAAECMKIWVQQNQGQI